MRSEEGWAMREEIPRHVITPAVCLSQYLKMRFGRGMQLLGSIQFLVATVRKTTLCSLTQCWRSCNYCNFMQIFGLVWTQFAKSSPVRHFCNAHRLIMTSKTALVWWLSLLFPSFLSCFTQGSSSMHPPWSSAKVGEHFLKPACLEMLSITHMSKVKE